MCGIAGKVSTRGAVEPALLEQMCATLRHRGPDHTGTWSAGGAALGMTRLAIIDVAGGEQPMRSEDGSVVLVFNGEIYNHRELQRRLEARGHRFASHSDAEVVVHLWEDLGPACVRELRGMFAFAVWDRRRGQLFLARDRIGKKPLFYAQADGGLVFGSEPRAVLQDPAVPADVDPRALDAFLVNQYVPHHLCAFRHLRKLPPASTLLWSAAAGPVVEPYWHLDHRPPLALSRADAVERVRELLLDATRVRLESDVPLGAFLSGGIDSAAVVAAMARTASGTVRTFSVAFDDDELDESPVARRVAEHVGTEHTELHVGPISASLLPRVAWHAGEPFADPAALPTFALAECARQEITVALTGDGGDEAFGGYRRYAQLAATRPGEVVPRRLRRLLDVALGRVAGGREGRSALPRAARLAHRMAMDPPHRYAALLRACSEDDRRTLYGPALAGELDTDPVEHLARAWARAGELPWVERAIAVDLHTYLSDDLVAKVDVTTMAHGLEVRSPLLDHELLEICARLPAAYNRVGGGEKRLLRDAAAPWLPPEVVDRPKHGFAVPLAGWLRGPLAHVAEDVLLDPVSVGRGMLDPDGVRAIIAQHAAGLDRSRLLYTLISLELWFCTCVDRRAMDPGSVPALA